MSCKLRYKRTHMTDYVDAKTLKDMHAVLRSKREFELIGFGITKR